MNRLVLNLCHAAYPHEDLEFRTRTGLEPPSFAACPGLGNIGGPVHTFPNDFEDEEFERDDVENALGDTVGNETPSNNNRGDSVQNIQPDNDFRIEEISA